MLLEVLEEIDDWLLDELELTDELGTELETELDDELPPRIP